MSSLARARALADAIMMEGYALYPYRATAPKNRYRWTFGVLAPRAWSEAGGCEPWWLEVQLLVAGTPTRVHAELRGFQIDRRDLEDDEGRPVGELVLDGELVLAWDDGIARTIAFEIPSGHGEVPFELAGAFASEARDGGRIVRERPAVRGRIAITRERLTAADPVERITLRVENLTPWHDLEAPRTRAILASLASTHLLVAVEGGELLSPIDPPQWAPPCTNVRCFAALAGPPGSHDVIIAGPFAMQDHAQLAPESKGDLCDATEIDELLTLRTRMLGDAEKREARATDARAAAIVAMADAVAPDVLARMHGARRGLAAGEMIPVVTGSKVRLCASPRRTDVQDLLYVGRIATVVGTRDDVDGSSFLVVSIDDDPASELHDWYGRHRYYRLDEVEPL
jgi:hypothetical protein